MMNIEVKMEVEGIKFENLQELVNSANKLGKAYEGNKEAEAGVKVIQAMIAHLVGDESAKNELVNELKATAADKKTDEPAKKPADIAEYVPAPVANQASAPVEKKSEKSDVLTDFEKFRQILNNFIETYVNDYECANKTWDLYSAVESVYEGTVENYKIASMPYKFSFMTECDGSYDYIYIAVEEVKLSRGFYHNIACTRNLYTCAIAFNSNDGAASHYNISTPFCGWKFFNKELTELIKKIDESLSTAGIGDKWSIQLTAPGSHI